MVAAQQTDPRDTVVVADPCGRPNPRLVVAAARAGALGVLDLPDLSAERPGAATAIAAVTARTPAPFAVRLPHDVAAASDPGADGPWAQLPAQVGTVVLAGALPPDAGVVGADDGARPSHGILEGRHVRAGPDEEADDQGARRRSPVAAARGEGPDDRADRRPRP